METLTVSGGLTTHSMMVQGTGSDGPQIVQVLSLKDATALSKAMSGMADVKTEDPLMDQ